MIFLSSVQNYWENYQLPALLAVISYMNHQFSPNRLHANSLLKPLYLLPFFSRNQALTVRSLIGEKTL